MSQMTSSKKNIRLTFSEPFQPRPSLKQNSWPLLALINFPRRGSDSNRAVLASFQSFLITRWKRLCLDESHAGNGSPLPPTLYLSPEILWLITVILAISFTTLMEKHPLSCHLLFLPTTAAGSPRESFAPAWARILSLSSSCCLLSPWDYFTVSLPRNLHGPQEHQTHAPWPKLIGLSCGVPCSCS